MRADLANLGTKFGSGEDEKCHLRVGAKFNCCRNGFEYGDRRANEPFRHWFAPGIQLRWVAPQGVSE